MYWYLPCETESCKHRDHFLFSVQIPENSGSDYLVGTLTTSDPDNAKKKWQSFTYTLLDTAGGRFKVDGDKIKVLITFKYHTISPLVGK